jgi:CRP-like cAMP-binding protein
MSSRSKLWYVQQCKLFQVLSDAQRRHLAQTAHMFDVKRGQHVYLSGDPAQQIFLLKSGIIKIVSLSPDDREVVLAYLHPGDVFGELAVVDDAPRDHSAEVQEDARLCSLNRELILGLVREFPDLGCSITKLIGSRARQFRMRLEQLLCRSASARLAHALADLADEHGVVDDHGSVIPFRLSQRDLGNLVGLTRETVNAVLQDFRRRGLIEVQHRNIRVPEPRKLRAVL